MGVSELAGMTFWGLLGMLILLSIYFWFFGNNIWAGIVTFVIAIGVGFLGLLIAYHFGSSGGIR